MPLETKAEPEKDGAAGHAVEPTATTANQSVSLVECLGPLRVVSGSVLLVVGLFYVFALSQASHFGWGFRFLKAAMVFALVALVVLLVDTVEALVRLVRRSRRAPEATGPLLAYLVVMWALWALYFAIMF